MLPPKIYMVRVANTRRNAADAERRDQIGHYLTGDAVTSTVTPNVERAAIFTEIDRVVRIAERAPFDAQVVTYTLHGVT